MDNTYFAAAAALHWGALMLGQSAASLGPPRSSQRRSPMHKNRQRSRQHHIRTFQTVHPWMIPLPGRVIRRRWARLQPKGPWRRILRRTPCLQTRAHPLPTQPPRWSTSTRTPRSARLRQYAGSNWDGARFNLPNCQIRPRRSIGRLRRLRSPRGRTRRARCLSR